MGGLRRGHERGPPEVTNVDSGGIQVDRPDRALPAEQAEQQAPDSPAPGAPLTRLLPGRGHHERNRSNTAAPLPVLGARGLLRHAQHATDLLQQPLLPPDTGNGRGLDVTAHPQHRWLTPAPARAAARTRRTTTAGTGVHPQPGPRHSHSPANVGTQPDRTTLLTCFTRQGTRQRTRRTPTDTSPRPTGRGQPGTTSTAGRRTGHTRSPSLPADVPARPVPRANNQ